MMATIAWRHRLGEGRVLYSAIGHQGATYDIPAFQQLMANAVAWAAGLPALTAFPQAQRVKPQD
jgi:type 1 glutamine amidotransferase